VLRPGHPVQAQELGDGQLDAGVAAQDGSGHGRHCSRVCGRLAWPVAAS
jgi:hypothetical protein